MTKSFKEVTENFFEDVLESNFSSKHLSPIPEFKTPKTRMRLEPSENIDLYDIKAAIDFILLGKSEEYKKKILIILSDQIDNKYYKERRNA